MMYSIKVLSLLIFSLIICENINNDNNWFLYDHEVEIIKHKGGTYWLYKKKIT
jgi:hypothetical protein